jgi:hypothetical protein
MPTKITALATLVLAAGYAAAAMAQTNAPSINAASNTKTTSRTTTPSGPGAPVTTPSHPSAQNPTINPSAAGTQNDRERYGSSNRHVEHSTTQPLNAQTHPFKAMKANREMRKKQRANQTGLPPPR